MNSKYTQLERKAKPSIANTQILETKQLNGDEVSTVTNGNASMQVLVKKTKTIHANPKVIN